METVRLTMAQALLRFLDQQYVELDGVESKFFQGVMGIFGHGNVTGIGQALEQNKEGLVLIQGKNEQGMAHAAIAFAKQKNRLATYACTSSIGPGALNMVTAAAVATVNRIPLLLLPGDIFASRLPDPVLQQIEYPMDYTISANDAFKPVSKFWDRISRPEQLIPSALHAIRVLVDPAETGAVTLSLPQDVQCEAYDYPQSFFEKRIHRIARQQPAPIAIQEAAQLLADAKKPLIIAGGGVHYSQAIPELLQLSEQCHIPVVETQAGKSAMSWLHPMSFGGVGVTGTEPANLLTAGADLIIAVGTRLADFSTSSKTAFANPNVKFININVSNMDANKTTGGQIVADAKIALQQLLVAMQAISYQSAYSIEQLQQLKLAWDKEVDRLYEADSELGLVQTSVLGEINNFIGEKDVIVCAAGSMPGDLHRMWRTTAPKTYHMEYGFSCMGYEVSGAFGVKLAEPEHEVYALVGDGSYLMLHSELLTSIQEEKKITILLLDNHGFQCIHNLQRENGSGSFGNEFRARDEQGQLSGPYMDIDFAAHARSMGANAYSVTSKEQLRDALKLAKQQTKTTLISIPVLPGTNTSGYHSWWQVGVAEVSTQPAVQARYEDYIEKVQFVKPLL
ncbi:MAG TPA: 3D-(3,5/4)-trihydroxycyclohexane-1,2-dione acylhydrolase (decyclizing) [Candidatus Paenibacillus intestinavium]|nr:3D-(3,5/4)-trihydroxycyclohexane-1,2-dione acylhydrolase (decyclizing) [Candidatus Paenibacillus intestinavium]